MNKSLTLADEMARFTDMVLSLSNAGSLVSFESSENWIGKTVTEGRKGSPTSEPEGSVGQGKAKIASKKDEDPNERVKRQVGDVAVWRYYAKTIGVWYGTLLLLFTATAAVSTNFPRQCLEIQYHQAWLTDEPNQGCGSRKVLKA